MALRELAPYKEVLGLPPVLFAGGLIGWWAMVPQLFNPVSFFYSLLLATLM
jgi:hypothetical protein